MMKLLVIALAFASLGCASAPIVQHNVIVNKIQPAESLLEQNIYNSIVRFININADVADNNISLNNNDELIEFYTSVINHRIIEDLNNNGIHNNTDRMYSILLTDGNVDFVFVVRIGSVSPNGSFQNLPGLIYRFDGKQRNVLSVSPSFY